MKHWAEKGLNGNFFFKGLSLEHLLQIMYTYREFRTIEGLN